MPPSPPIQDTAVLLTKPAEWPTYMVSATVTVTRDWSDWTKFPKEYASGDTCKLDILNALNYAEAHGTYTWPDFPGLGHNFSESMRFRRALVHDVFAALKTGGSIRVLGLPQLGALSSSARKREGSGVLGSEKKRVCSTDAYKAATTGGPSPSTTTPSETDEDEEYWDNEETLSEAMRELIGCCSYADIHPYLRGEKDPHALARIVYDGLVEHWDGPAADHGILPDGLKAKLDAWTAAKAAAPKPLAAPEKLADVRSSDKFPATVMGSLIARSGAKVKKYVGEKNDEDTLANSIFDGLMDPEHALLHRRVQGDWPDKRLAA